MEEYHKSWDLDSLIDNKEKWLRVFRNFTMIARTNAFLTEFGPESDKPLTLRVYGTIMKGFSILNNERARLLYTDCERVVVMFAQRPFVEDTKNPKGPPAKRQRTDALALDLSLSHVHLFHSSPKLECSQEYVLS